MGLQVRGEPAEDGHALRDSPSLFPYCVFVFVNSEPFGDPRPLPQRKQSRSPEVSPACPSESTDTEMASDWSREQTFTLRPGPWGSKS